MAEPISFSFEPTIRGVHADVVVRCGPNGSRAFCGSLTMRTQEWHLLRWLLATTPPLDSNERYVPVWARGYPGNVQRSVPIDNTPVVCQPERMAKVYGERLASLAAAAAAVLERLRETGVVAEVESLMAEDEAGLERTTITPAAFDALLDAAADTGETP